jgi:two-component system, NtrC family, sensor kinase
MKRRPRAGGKSAKAKQPEAPKLKRRPKSNEAIRRTSSARGEKAEVARLTRELNEALEEQTATSEVLEVISSYPGKLEPVFAAILGSATRICEAKLGNLFLREGETFRAVAWHGEPTYVENWRREPLIININEPNIPLARLVQTMQRVHVADLREDAAYKAGFAPLVTLVDMGGARTLLIVPMLKEHTLVGAIAIYRQEVRPFTAKQIALVERFAAPSSHRHRERAVARGTAAAHQRSHGAYH